MEALIIFLAFWVACGVLAYGYTLAYFQEEFPMNRDEVGDFYYAASAFLGGPIFLFVIFVDGGTKHGLKWIPEGPMTWDEYYRSGRYLQ